jgi:hypothetical protein
VKKGNPVKMAAVVIGLILMAAGAAKDVFALESIYGDRNTVDLTRAYARNPSIYDENASPIW